MRTRQYPTRLGTDPAPAPPAALHLIRGRWVASCPTCGYQLASSTWQERAERQARRRRCPVCREVA
jgi:hypothetical protein